MAAFRQGFWGKLKSLVIVASGGTVAFSAIGLYQGNDRFYRNLVMPAIHFLFDPETAHKFSLFYAKFGLIRQSSFKDLDCILETSLWNLKFKNPIGIAAGFDKDGEAVSGLFKTGIGFIEIGSVTPLPQPGNPRPALFRLVDDEAVINRLGFNSRGHEYVHTRLQLFNKEKGVLGINLGKNKLSECAAEDYAQGVREFLHVADYLTINISSPNTPGLRSLQKREALEKILDKVIETRYEERSKVVEIRPGEEYNEFANTMRKHTAKPPLLVKISPDLTQEEKQDIAKAIMRKGKEVDGLIISNTTISRPNTLLSKEKNEIGGLSGKPLAFASTQTIHDMYRLTNGKIPIIGVGGVSSGKDAYEKIRAGASLVQLYTALVYGGPPVIDKIKKELKDLLVADGYKNVKEAVGADHRKS